MGLLLTNCEKKIVIRQRLVAIVGIRFPKLFLINGLSTSTKLRAYATARMKEISQGGESTPSVYPFAMDTSGSLRSPIVLFVQCLVALRRFNSAGWKGKKEMVVMRE